MRTLGIETSGLRGSVALAEDGRVLARAEHSAPNRHAEETLRLIQRVLAEVGWERTSLDRVGVSVGPGAFTGVRVGLSLGAGLSLGLGIVGVGVGSLAGLAALDRLTPEGRLADPRPSEPTRVVLRDARREEYFFAAYAPNGEELVPPEAIAQEGALAIVRARLGERLFRVVGLELPDVESVARDPEASSVALLAEILDPAAHPLEPNYVRGSGAIRPQLPPSPFDETGG